MMTLRNLLVVCLGLMFIFCVTDAQRGRPGRPMAHGKGGMKGLMDKGPMEKGPMDRGPMVFMKVMANLIHNAICNNSYAAGKTAEECSDCMMSVDWVGLMMNPFSMAIAPKMCIKEYLQPDYHKCAVTAERPDGGQIPSLFGMPIVAKICKCMSNVYYLDTVDRCSKQVQALGDDDPTKVFLQTVDCIGDTAKQIIEDFSPIPADAVKPMGPQDVGSSSLIQMFLSEWLYITKMML